MTSYQSPGERLAASFAAWEIRGRGWQLADYPVELEPPFRPFFLLPGAVADGVVIDEGKRPTIASTIISFARAPIKALTHSPPATPEPYVEPLPREAIAASSLVHFSVTVPSDFQQSDDLTGQLLLALGASMNPVSFELIGHDSKVRIQISVPSEDAEAIRRLIESFAPDAVVTAGDDALASSWAGTSGQMIVDFGLSEEFFLPLVTDHGRDSFLPLIPGLASAGRGEVTCLQVTFQRARNAWANTVREVVGETESDCLYADAPYVATLAKEKTRTPLFAATLRLGLASRERSRLRELGRAVMPFIKSLERPGSNELIPLENDDYPDDEHIASFLNRQSFRSGMILSLDELAALVHLPDAIIQSEALVRDSKRTRVLPHAAVGDTRLGNTRHAGRLTPVTVSLTDRLSHTHIIGATGVGKSTLMHALAMQDIMAGRGIAVLDPSGDLVDDIARSLPRSRAKDVVYFDPVDIDHPIGLGLLEASTELEKMALVDDITGIFQRLSTSWGDTMTTVLANAVLATLEHPAGGTLLDIRRLLVDDDFRKTYVAKLNDPEVQFFWQKQYGAIGTRSVGPILSRLDSFLRPRSIRNIVAVRRTRHSPARALAEGKILLAKLSHGLLGEQNSYLLGSLLIAKLQQAAMARQAIDREQRSPFFLYVDEAHHFVTPSLTSLLTGSRKYALGAVLAHQHLSQLNGVPEFKEALLGSALTRIVFRVGENDAKELAGGFAHFSNGDLLNLDRGEAVGRFGESGKDFSLGTVRYTAQADSLPLQDLQALSRANYASPVEVVQPMVESVAAEPVPPEESATAPVVVPVPPPVRDDGRVLTYTPPPQDAGKGGREHRYVQQLIKRLGEDRGFKATIEYPVEDGRVDIVLERKELSLAFEISVTNTAGYEIGNVEKCLRASFTHVYFVCADGKRREKVKAAIGQSPSSKTMEYIPPEQVVLALDAFEQTATESVVRGYRVKINRPNVSSRELAGKREVIAEVIAKSLVR